MKFLIILVLLASMSSLSSAFVPRQQPQSLGTTNNNNNKSSSSTLSKDGTAQQQRKFSTLLYKKISPQRKKQLGILDTEDEYDLGYALDRNTDPIITKIIAGSLIVVLIGLLVAGVIIPYTTDYGEGVCNPILTQGRC